VAKEISAAASLGTNRVLEFPEGEALGTSFRWSGGPSGGQYCAIHTAAGIVGCGIYDVDVAGEFGLAVAIAKGTPELPLCEPEDLYQAEIVACSKPAKAMGIEPGMTGIEAVRKMLGSV
jgi:uncharacterized protein YunC (DUF1805 family)